jgi:hypothetical protein
VQYLRWVVADGDDLNDYLADMPKPLKKAVRFIGLVVDELAKLARLVVDVTKAVAGWVKELRRAEPPASAVGSALARLATSATVASGAVRSVSDHTNRAHPLMQALAKAVALFVAALAVAKVLQFAAAVGKLAFQFTTWPLRAARDAYVSVKNFVTAAAQLVSRTVTITQNVVRSGAEVIRSLPWVYGEVTQLVKRTGATLVTQVKDVTGTVTQKIVAPTEKTIREVGVEIIKGIAKGVAAGLAGALAALGVTGAFGGAAAGVLSGIGTALAAIPAAGWIVLAVIIAAAIVAALIWVFKDEVWKFLKAVPGFFEDLPGLIVEGLKKLPRLVGKLFGLAAGAAVLALVGIPALAVKGIVEGLKKFGPKVVDAFGDAFKAIPKMLDKLVSPSELVVKGLGKLRDVIGSIPPPSVLALRALKGLGDFITGLPQNTGKAAVALGGLVTRIDELPGATKRAVVGAVSALKDLAREFDRLPGIVARALSKVVTSVATAAGNILRAVLECPLGRAASYIMDEFRRGFAEGWRLVDEATGGALSGIVGILSEYYTTIFNAAKDLGKAIVEGIAAGVSTLVGLASSLVEGLKSAFVTAGNWVIGLINDAIPNSFGWGPMSINIPDNPIPTIELHRGGVVPGRWGEDVLAVLQAGEVVLPTDVGQRGGLSTEVRVDVTGFGDFEDMKRRVLREVERQLDESAARAGIRSPLVTQGVGAPRL